MSKNKQAKRRPARLVTNTAKLKKKTRSSARGALNISISTAAPLALVPSNPVTAYLLRLSPSSRHTMRKLLNRITRLFGATTTADRFPWHRLSYSHTLVHRERMAQSYAAASANVGLAAVRGMLRESWRLGLMPHEEYYRAADLSRVRGDRLRPRPEIKPALSARLLKHCARDGSPKGVRDLAILSVLYACGLRRGEPTRLDLEHVLAAGTELKVFGKGMKWRVSYLSRQARSAF